VGQVSGKWRVNCSTCPGSSFYPRGGQEKKEGGWKKSEAYVVYSRECYIWRSDHQGDESVSESADHDWHYYKEDYYEGMCCNDYIVDLVISEEGSGLA